MLIACPQCATAYEVTPAALGDGRTVRCARCRTAWFARVPETVAAAVEPAGGEINPAPAPLPNEPAQAHGEAASLPALIEPSPTLAPSLAEDEPQRLRSGPASLDDTAPETSAGARLAVPMAPKHSRRNWRVPLAALIIVAVVIGLAAGRHDVVRAMPQTALLYAAIGLPVNVRGLAFADVAIVREAGESVEVRGRITNVSSAEVAVPALRFAGRDARGREVISWNAPPPRARLAAGESVSFQSQTSAPADLREVLVRFARPQDGASFGLRTP